MKGLSQAAEFSCQQGAPRGNPAWSVLSDQMQHGGLLCSFISHKGLVATLSV